MLLSPLATGMRPSSISIPMASHGLSHPPVGAAAIAAFDHHHHQKLKRSRRFGFQSTDMDVRSVDWFIGNDLRRTGRYGIVLAKWFSPSVEFWSL